jgi:hypothetical protein
MQTKRRGAIDEGDETPKFSFAKEENSFEIRFLRK